MGTRLERVHGPAAPIFGRSRAPPEPDAAFPRDARLYRELRQLLHLPDPY